MEDIFDEARAQLGADKVDTFLSKFGLGPKYVPHEPPKYKCPRCGGDNAIYKEEHPDTDMNVIALICPNCNYSSEND